VTSVPLVMATCPGPTATSFFDETSTHMSPKDMDSSESVVRRTNRRLPGTNDGPNRILVAQTASPRPCRTHRRDGNGQNGSPRLRSLAVECFP
jgi:hypothetical protein